MILIDEITKAAAYKGGKKAKEDYIDAVSLFFQNYYGGKANDQERPDILNFPIQTF